MPQPFWAGPDSGTFWQSLTSDIIKDQALEEAIRESANVDATQISTAMYWPPYDDLWHIGASDILAEQA